MIGSAASLADTWIGGLPGLGGRLNVNAMRPYFDPKTGDSFIVVNGKKHRTNAPASLQYDEWVDIDRTVLEAYFATTQAVEALRSRGLTHSLGSVGKTVSLYDRESDITEAGVDMSGITVGEEDRVAYNPTQVPVPVYHKDWRLNWRQLEASRSEGESLDASMSRLSGRKVAEAEEITLIQGNTNISVDGSVVWGYMSHPDRNLVDMPVSWDDSSVTGQDIVAQVLEAVKSLRNDFRRGPYALKVPLAYSTKLDEDYNPGTSDTRTIRQRLLAIEGISEIMTLEFLPTENVLVVQLDRQTVDWASAMGISTIQWPERGGLQQRFVTLSVGTPRVKSDYDGRSGIAHIVPIPT